MAVVRRHWKVMVFCLVALVVGAAWLLLFSSGSQATVQAQMASRQEQKENAEVDKLAARESLDEQTYYAVTELRRQLMLGNEDLAAMGCTGASSRVILEELLGWYEANREKLQDSRRNRLAAEREYRDAMRRVNMGPKDDALIARLPQLLSSMGEAVKQERELTESAIPAIENKLNADQCSHWTSVRNQRHMPGLYRYVPELSAEQKRNVCDAVGLAAYRRMTARTEEQHQLTKSAEREEANSLSSSQTSAMEEVKANLQQNLPDILKASQNALPAPRQPVMTGADIESVQKMMQEQQAQ